MKTLTVHLPDPLAAELAAEARARRISMSHLIRERLSIPHGNAFADAAFADLVGSLDGLPADLSARKKRYLRTRGDGRKHRR